MSLREILTTIYCLLGLNTSEQHNSHFLNPLRGFYFLALSFILPWAFLAGDSLAGVEVEGSEWGPGMPEASTWLWNSCSSLAAH